MLVCAAGDIHGAINRLFQNVLAFEEIIGARFDCVLHVGDFGIWPDANRIDKAARDHDGAGDFPRWLSNAQHVDIVLTHEAPMGVCFRRHGRGKEYVSKAQGFVFGADHA